MDKLIVSITGLLSIIGVYWFFFGKKEKTSIARGSVTITVSGGYSPKNISIPKNQKTSLIFLRTDPNTCLDELVIPDMKIKKHLPMHSPVTIVLSPTREGIYNFHCGMNMFHGKITVS